MTDVGHGDMQLLFDAMRQMQVFLGRSAVQTQILAICGALVAAWLLAMGIWRLFGRRLQRWVEKKSRQVPETSFNFWKYIVALFVIARHILFPCCGLLTFVAVFIVLTTREEVYIGLYFQAVLLMVEFFVYRFFLALLYVLIPKKEVRYSQTHLFAPLFAAHVIWDIMDTFIDLHAICRIEVMRLFENPVTIGALLISTVGLYFWVVAVRSIHTLLLAFITARTKKEAGVIEASLTIVRYVLILLGLFYVFSSLRLNATTIAAITGGLSVGLGFGLNTVLSNFVSGLLLLFERAIHPGDVIELDGQIGRVTKLSIRSTTVRTLNNIEIIVPNQTFINASVTRYTGSDRVVRLLIPVGVGYNEDPEQVRELLHTVAREHPDVLDTPKPAAFLTGFGDSSVDFQLAAWIAKPLRILPITSELNRMIWAAFREHEIEIPFPQQDLHIRSGFHMQSDASPVLGAASE